MIQQPNFRSEMVDRRQNELSGKAKHVKPGAFPIAQHTENRHTEVNCKCKDKTFIIVIHKA